MIRKLNIFATVLGLMAVIVQCGSDDPFVCEPGIAYKENNCNNCACSRGRLACTVMYCEGYDDMRNCVPGTTTQNDCNTCQCVRDLGTVCTNLKC